VIAEMSADQTRGGNSSADLRTAPLSAASTTPAPAAPDSVPATEVAALLATRDARTAELEAAISELQAAGAERHDPSGDPLTPDQVRMAEERFAAALERIEARLAEQEQSFRHVLTMLIEWLEEDPSREAA
jgi:general secretion pathway protein A